MAHYPTLDGLDTPNHSGNWPVRVLSVGFEYGEWGLLARGGANSLGPFGPCTVFLDPVRRVDLSLSSNLAYQCDGCRVGILCQNLKTLSESRTREYISANTYAHTLAKTRSEGGSGSYHHIDS